MIVKADWSKYRNYEFIQFFSHFIELAETFDLEELLLKEHVEIIKPELDDLERLYEKYTGNILTKKLVDLDDKRDKLIGYIRKTVEAQRLHYNTKKSNVAQEIDAIINQYGGASIERLPYAQETLAIRKLYSDLILDSKYVEGIKLLGLTESLELLIKINEEFQTLFVERTKDDAGEEDLNSIEIRAKIVSLFTTFLEHLKAYDVLNKGEKYTMLRAEVNELIDKTNYSAKVRSRRGREDDLDSDQDEITDIAV